MLGRQQHTLFADPTLQQQPLSEEPLTFPPMSAANRKCLHSLAERFGAQPSLLIGAELWKNSCCQLLTDLLVWQGCAANRTAKTARRRRSGTRGCGCGRRRSRLYSRCPTCCRAAARASCATPRSPAKVRRGRSSPHDSPWRGVTHTTCSRDVPWQAATVWRCGRPRPAPTARPRRSCRWPRQPRSGEGWRAILRRCPRSRLRRVDCMCRR